MKFKQIFYFLFVTLLFSLLSTSLFGSEQQVWVGISPKVLTALTQQPIPIIHPLDTVEGDREIFFKLPEDELKALGQFIHQTFLRCGGFRVVNLPPLKDLSTHVKDPSAKEIPGVEFGEFWPNELDKFIRTDYSVTRQSTVNEWMNAISETHMNEIITELSSFHTRYYDTSEGIAAMYSIGERWGNLTKIRNDVRLEFYKHTGFNQPSVILTFVGSDINARNEIIILGGHADSINSDDQHAHLAAPGADDNAAGIAVLSDIIKIMVEKNYRPQHTIQFMAYAAEEVGLRGSGEIASQYKKNQIRVKGVLQFDGVNYRGKTYEMSLLSDGVSPAQSVFLAKLADEYIKTNWAWEKCGYACSDHYSWHLEGYRASFPAETIASEQNPYFHTANDTFDKSNFSSNHAAMFEKLGIAYLLELDK
jgi:leucyl aminopeptidase